MATLKIVYRPSSRGEAYVGCLCLRLIHQRRVRQLSTPWKLYKHEWDSFRGIVIIPDENSERFSYLVLVSSALDSYVKKFDQIIDRLKSCTSYRIEDITSIYGFRDDPSSMTFLTRRISSRLEQLGSGRTARAYQTACRAFVTYNHGEDILLEQIDSTLIKSYESWMKDNGKSLNTISYHMRLLRAIYHRAVRDKVIPAKEDNPFAGVFIGFQQTRKRALTIEELKALNNLEYSSLLDQHTRLGKVESSSYSSADMRLYTAWRLFMFCFHARGMSFVDMAYLQKTNLRGGIINYYRKKTGKKMEISITPFLKRIIDSFAYDVRDSIYLFPIIVDVNISARLQYESSLRLQNTRLKKISQMAGIGKSISTHVSRHSWATIGKKKNLPLWVISEGLGHATEKMTYTYLASFDKATLDAANELISDAIGTSPNYYV